LKVEAREEIWPLDHPFRISRGSRAKACVVVVTVTDGQHTGRGEGVPIARYNQTVSSVLAQIELMQQVSDLDRDKLQRLLPARRGMRSIVRFGTWKRNVPANALGNWRTSRFPITSRRRSQSALLRLASWPPTPTGSILMIPYFLPVIANTGSAIKTEESQRRRASCGGNVDPGLRQ